ncbi:MAG: MotA/TolQ/ExbB proton channel family protein [Cytophagales bacterium]
MNLLGVLLQITTGQSELGISTPEANSTTDITLIDLVMKGGIIMIPIFVLSFISIYIIVERILAIKKAGKNANNLLATITPAIKSGDVNTAKSLLRKEDSSIALILTKGLSKIGNPIKQIENAMEATGKLEVMKLEKGLAILGIVASIAPMLGFVGTISGVIKIFYNISLADNISIGLIAGGLYEKMVTSAAGLIVGIIAHTGYHYINMMIENMVLKMETTSLEFTELLSE